MRPLGDTLGISEAAQRNNTTDRDSLGGRDLFQKARVLVPPVELEEGGGRRRHFQQRRQRGGEEGGGYGGSMLLIRPPLPTS